MTQETQSLLRYGVRDWTWRKLSQNAQNVPSETLAQRIAEATQDFEPIKKFKDIRPKPFNVDIPTSSDCYHLNFHAMKKGNLNGRL